MHLHVVERALAVVVPLVINLINFAVIIDMTGGVPGGEYRLFVKGKLIVADKLCAGVFHVFRVIARKV